MTTQHGEIIRTLTVDTKGFDASRFLMGFHEDWATGSMGDVKFELTRSLTSLNISAVVTFPNGDRVTETVDLGEFVERWVTEITVSYAAGQIRAEAAAWHDERADEQNHDTSSTSRPEAQPMFDDLTPAEQAEVITRFLEEER